MQVQFGEARVADVPSEQTESTTHSFIVKITIEKTIGATGAAQWRGYVTHVPDGERRYLRDLGEILDFIIPYLENAPIRLGIYYWLTQWREWKKRMRKNLLHSSAQNSTEES